MAETERFNLTEIAEAMGAAPQTVKGWIKRGMPCEGDGKQGKPYTFDLEACLAWREKDLADQQAETKARRDRIAELDLGRQADDPLADLSLAEQERAIKIARLRHAAELERGDLVRKSDARQKFTELYGLMRDRLQGLPDYLERTLGLDPGQTQAAIDAVDAWQQDLAELCKQDWSKGPPDGRLL